MNLTRDELAATVGPDMNIYAVGGYGGPEMMCLKSAERYNPISKQWENLGQMSTPRRALATVALPDGIYAIGGYDGRKYLRTVERFDLGSKQWVPVSPLNHPRCTLTAVATPDCQYIYAIGGFNGSAVSIVERYSVVEDRWTIIEDLLQPRFMHCSVLLCE